MPPTFIAELFIYNNQEMEPTQSIGRGMDKDVEWNIISHEKNEVLLFATTWVNLEGTMLSEIEKDKYDTISLRCGISDMKQTNREKKRPATTTKKVVNTENKLVVARGKEGGG